MSGWTVTCAERTQCVQTFKVPTLVLVRKIWLATQLYRVSYQLKLHCFPKKHLATAVLLTKIVKAQILSVIRKAVHRFASATLDTFKQVKDWHVRLKMENVTILKGTIATGTRSVLIRLLAILVGVAWDILMHSSELRALTVDKSMNVLKVAMIAI